MKTYNITLTKNGVKTEIIGIIATSIMEAIVSIDESLRKGASLRVEEVSRNITITHESGGYKAVCFGEEVSTDQGFAELVKLIAEKNFHELIKK